MGNYCKCKRIIKHAKKNGNLVVVVSQDKRFSLDKVFSLVQSYRQLFDFNVIYIIVENGEYRWLQEKYSDFIYVLIDEVKLEKLLTKKVDVMGELIYKNTKVISLNFAQNSELENIYNLGVMTFEYLVWNRMLFQQNMYIEPLNVDVE